MTARAVANAAATLERAVRKGARFLENVARHRASHSQRHTPTCCHRCARDCVAGDDFGDQQTFKFSPRGTSAMK